jgi:FKBP-type peptidyl-prolyl cis-trans isomerase FklB
MIRLSALSVFAASLLIGSTASAAAQSTSSSAVNQISAPAMQNVPINPPFRSSKEQISYSIGVDLGENFKEQGIDIDPTLIAQGLKDAARGKTLLSQAQMLDILKNFQQQLISKKEAELKVLSNKNKQLGDAFLAENKKKPGVITTKSGMQYKIVTPGKGDMPTDNSIVQVDYTGSLIDGTVFDKSKEPVTFPISNVIPGWTEVLKLMKPGATFEVVIPPQLAYGEHGVNKTIGPNQTLLFTIHLIEVKKGAGKV